MGLLQCFSFLPQTEALQDFRRERPPVAIRPFQLPVAAPASVNLCGREKHDIHHSSSWSLELVLQPLRWAMNAIQIFESAHTPAETHANRFFPPVVYQNIQQ